MPRSFTPKLPQLPQQQLELWPHLARLPSAGLVLHGGTAIALRLGHRDSVDFDYFTDQPLNRSSLYTLFPEFASATIIQDEPNTLAGFIKMPSGTVKVSFFGAIQFGRIGEPETTDDRVAIVASIHDLLAQKLKTVMQRVEVKDYRDIAAIIRAGIPLLAGMTGAMALYGGQFSPLECARALVYFKDRQLATLSTIDKSTLAQAVQTFCSNTRNLRPAAILSPFLAA